MFLQRHKKRPEAILRGIPQKTLCEKGVTRPEPENTTSGCILWLVLYNALQTSAIPLAEGYYTARAVEHDA